MPSPLVIALVGFGCFVLGGLVVFLVRQRITSRKLRIAEEDAQKLLNEARDKQKEILLEAKEEAIKARTAVEAEYRERRSELQRQEKRLSQKEESVDHKTEVLERRERDISGKEKEVESLRNQLEGLRQKQLHQLELISSMSAPEAKELLLQRVEEEIREDEVRRLHEMEAKFKELASTALSGAKVVGALQMVHGLDELKDISELVKYLVP